MEPGESKAAAEGKNDREWGNVGEVKDDSDAAQVRRGFAMYGGGLQPSCGPGAGLQRVPAR